MRTRKEQYKINQLIDITCEECKISKTALFSRSRIQDIVDARMIINHVLVVFGKMTFIESGRVLHRTKANMAWLEERFLDLYQYNKILKNRYNRVVYRLNEKTKTHGNTDR